MPFPLWEERDSDSDGWVTAAPANVIDIETGEQFVRRAPRPIRSTRSVPDEPAEWMLEGCTWPGVPVGPYTLREAHRLAKTFGGRVLPWAARPQKAGGTYPHPGEMREGGKA